MRGSFCKTRHCRECRSILGLRGECKNRNCPRSPYFRYRRVRTDVVYGALKARSVLKVVEQNDD